MGCQATELTILQSLYKMDLTSINHHFNYDKFRVFIRLTCQTFDGSYQDYLGKVPYLKRQDNPGF